MKHIIDNIPIYRAKKIDSDEYVEGFLTQDFYTFKWFITDTVQDDEIDPSTLAIHFSDMIDSKGNKIFASLSEDGKGGSIVEDLGDIGYFYFNTITHSIVMKFEETITGFYKEYFKRTKILGIQE